MKPSEVTNSCSSTDNESTSSITTKQIKRKSNSQPKSNKKSIRPAKAPIATEPSLLNARQLPGPSSEPNSITENTTNKAMVAPDVPTYNPFSPLAVPDEMETTSAPPGPQRIPKPPPIYLKNVTRYADLCKALSQITGPNSFACKARAADLIIHAKTIDGYRGIIHYLKDKKAEYHTYQLEEEKAYRVVIRYLHQSTPPELIQQELAKHGHITRNVAPVIHPVSKQTLPLFFVDLEPRANNTDIFDLELLCYTKIKVEEPHKQRLIVQCKRCQEYGHTKSYCQHRPRCVKCAGEHLTQECGKHNTTPPICALCHGEHPANYKGCMVHRELQRSRRPPLGINHRSAISEATKSTSNRQQAASGTPRNTEPQTQRNNISATNTNHPSYARVVAGPPPPQPPLQSSSSDITTLLNSFLSDFKTLLTPLVTLLTTVVNTLLPRLAP